MGLVMTQETQNANHKRIIELELLPQLDALYGFAFHLTLNEKDAEDLVQDTFYRAVRSIHSYQSGTNAKAWLFQILKHVFINGYRKKSKRPTQVDYEEVSNFHREDDSPYSSYDDLREEMFGQMMGDEVTLAVNKLDVKFRIVILLCDIEGFSYAEIAKILDTPINTVRTRLHRARIKLKEELRDYALSLGFKGDNI